MDILTLLLNGFAVALSPGNLLACVLGVLLGTFVGIMPGLGPSATIAMLLPVIYGREPVSAMILLAGIFYGAKYGGAITAILVNLPGESSSVMTCLDGHEMAKQGKGGKAIGVAAIGGFFGGTVSVIGLTLLAPPLAEFALSFGPPEYFGVMLMGITAVAFLASKSMLKALMMGTFGLMLSCVGPDPQGNVNRFIYGQVALQGGIDFPIVGIGMFAIAEVMVNLERTLRVNIFRPPKGLRDVLPTWGELRDLIPTYLRSAGIGFFIGVLPGAGSTSASFLSYAFEKGVSPLRDKMGTGIPQGVAAPETADNAATGGDMVPTLTLGVPGGGATAMLMAALLMLGLRPGPLLMTERPDLVWGLIASMYIGNMMLLIINLPLAPLVSSLLRVPYHYLYCAILSVCLVGVYTLKNSMFDVWLALLFGLIGYAAKKLEYPAAPAVLALVLGLMAERNLRQSLVLSRGELSIFVERPMAAALLAVCLLFFLIPMVRAIRNWNATRRLGEEVVGS